MYNIDKLIKKSVATQHTLLVLNQNCISKKSGWDENQKKAAPPNPYLCFDMAKSSKASFSLSLSLSLHVPFI